MNLYMDDAMYRTDADAAALERALVRFKNLGGRRLELRRDPAHRFTLTRWENELFVEVATPGRLDGAVVDGWEGACAAARAYLKGKAPSVAKPAGRFLEVIMGSAWHPDCPLCRAQG